ncbi:MAG: autotransporter assembly complex protein TamA [Gammaproteobacteria bacterium]
MHSVTPEQHGAALRRARILAQIASSVCLALAAGGACAQGVTYNVRIDAPGALDDLLEDNLDLMRWRGNPRLDLEQLQRLVKAAPEQAKTLIATEGYYSPRISAGLDTSGTVPVARIVVDTGEPVLVGDVDLVLTGFEPLDPAAKPFDADGLRARWGLPVGRRFRMADWEASKRNLLRQVTQRRYPRAQITEHQAVVDPDQRRADLRVVVDSGPEARFGELKIEGLQRYSPTIIRNLNDIRPGDEYSETALQAFQARLQDTGYFSGVEVAADMGESLDEEIDSLQDGAPPRPRATLTNPQILPVLVHVTENKQKNASVGLGYSTNTGARAQVAYDDLNVRGLRMKSSIIMESKRQNARADFYFPTTAKGFNDSFGAGFERTDVQGETLRVASAVVRRSWGSPRLERSIALEYLTEQRTIAGRPEESGRRSSSVPLTYNWTRRTLDSLTLPTRGTVINAQLGGALLPVLTDERFIRAYTRVVNYRPVGPQGQIILRGELGAVATQDEERVPSTFLFRAGGDQSVRGYGYQQLGVKKGEATVGARYLLTGSAEYQYYFKPPWGVAVFYDAGNAAHRWRDLKPESGYGVGARWRSPVGPINVDVAYGAAVKRFHLHFSLGVTF